MAAPTYPGILHNDARKTLKDASLKEIADSIKWYTDTIKKFEDKKAADPTNPMNPVVPYRWKDNLVNLKVERGNRIGRK
jgi:hypothetical protein